MFYLISVCVRGGGGGQTEVELHMNTKVTMVEVRRKRQILTCIWRNIKKGIIEIATPTRETRNNIAPTIYLPVPKTELFKKSVFLLWCYPVECMTP